MNADLVNNDFYNKHFGLFDKIPFEEILIPLILKYLPKPCRLLEIGAGAGSLALWLTTLGHHVTCIEPAEKAAESAKARGLDVHITRLQDYVLTNKFECIIAVSSLIHISRVEMPFQIERLSQMMKSGGMAFVTFIEGRGEAYEDPTGKGKMRFFSKFTQEELEAMIVPFFSILETKKLEVKKMNQSFFLLVLKKAY